MRSTRDVANLDIEGCCTMTRNENAVAEVLSAYNAALNSSDTNAVMPLYAEDEVFMPPYSPTAVGAAEGRKAYDAVFKANQIEREVQRGRDRRAGPRVGICTNQFCGNDPQSCDWCREFGGQSGAIPFRKDRDGKFKIARYSPLLTNPPSN
jgi:ketosteroid isomerase-like protein